MEKKYLKTVVCAILTGAMLFAGGCGQAEEIDGAGFRKAMEKLGLKVNDQSADYKDQGADTVIVGYEKEKYQMEMYHFKKREQADQTFQKLSSQLISEYEGSTGYSIQKTKENNKESTVITGDGNYFEVVQVDNTLVYGVTSNGSEYKKKIREAYEEIGY
jgi:hypothetical protein